MFETSVVRVQAKAAERRFGLLSVSIAAHVAAIAAVVAGSIATVQLPKRAPNQQEIFRVETPPPMLGSQNGGPKPKPAVTPPQAPPKRDTAPPPRDVAPQVVPEHVTPAPGPDTTGPANANNDGVTGDGQPLGVPWGRPDGVVPDGPPSVAPPPPDVVYHLGESGVKAPVVVRRVSPPYPAIALKIHKSGFAVVACTIDKSGRIRDAHVVGSNFAAFEQPALDAVQQWLFTPGTRNGVPVDVEFELRVTFEVR
jgi:protein TonB